MQTCLTPLLSAPPKPMASPITSVAVLAATDNEMNRIASYKEILGFQLRKVPAVEAEELGSSPFTEVQNFFHPLCSAWRFYCHTPMSFSTANRTGTLCTVFNLQFSAVISLYAGMSCHKQKKYQDPCTSTGQKGCPAPCSMAFCVTASPFLLGGFCHSFVRKKTSQIPGSVQQQIHSHLWLT